MKYIATFYSHFGAMKYKKSCEAKGWPAQMMAVPRALSSSCGTCVSYESDTYCPFDNPPEEVDTIVIVHDEASYEVVYTCNE